MKFVVDKNRLLTKVILEDGDSDIAIVPNNVGAILGDAFKNAKTFKHVILPSNLSVINNASFENFESLEEICIPEKVTYLGYDVFKGCRNLKSVHLPESLLSISADLFSHCLSLEKINFPKNLRRIDKNAFAFTWLKEVILPPSVDAIASGAFSNMYRLENVKLTDKITCISEEAFKYCENLKNIELPAKLERIESAAFIGCKSIEKISLPDTVKFVMNSAFKDCKNLKEVKLSNSLEEIMAYTFEGTGLEKINIPNSVTSIYTGAFKDCVGEEIYLGDSLEEINDVAFENCDVKKLRIGNFEQLTQSGMEEIIDSLNYYYINDKTGEILAFDEEQEDLEGYIPIDYEEWYRFLGEDSYKGEAILLSLITEENKTYIKGDNLIYFFLSVIKKMNRENYKDIRKALENSKTFFDFIKRSYFYKEMAANLYHNGVIYCDLFFLAYSLGAFNDNQVVRQRACEFLNNAIEKKYFRFGSLHGSFESLEFKGYNEEWAKFFMDKKNFEDLVYLEGQQDGFMARIYNSFDGIREFGRSNRGNQRYRKVTVDMCKDYLANVSFEGVDDSNRDIAYTISNYTRNQDSFMEAVDIRKEFLQMKEKGEIGEYIIDEIDTLREETLKDMSSVLSDLNKVSNNEFSSEFLSKNDPHNFVLGKYCSCCSHLEGSGYGIMKASILHPDCQNLVIKDDSGRIIAKSTLYVNRTQGYGLFNNVEVNTRVSDDKLEAIYLKFKEAIEFFVSKYNEKNSDVPITVVNVGMSLNDLEEIITNRDSVASKKLKGIKFANYGKPGKMYNGDWQDCQYTIYKKTK